MSRYNQYGNSSNNKYYDPVGSQPAHPTGYSYQANSSTPSAQNAPSSSAYDASSYPSYGNNTYNNQQYGSSRQQTSNGANHAAAALNSLSGTQNYGQTLSAATSASNNRYSGSNSIAYISMQNRNETDSPLHPSTQSSSKFGRMSIPEQSQSSSINIGANQATRSSAPSTSSMRSSSYQTPYGQHQTQSPRYNSPLRAVQAHHSHRQQVPQTSNHPPSPQMINATQQNRQASASVESSATTVDPLQVYDNRAELQRKAQIDAEKRRKYEAEQVAKRAEEDRKAEEQRKRDVGNERGKAEAEAAKKTEEQERKNEQRRKAREDKKQSKNAATALQRLSSGNAEPPGPSTTSDEEAEMRAMFQKMREFNAKNPAMLAKLWEEERTSHEANKSTPPAPSSIDPAAQIGPSASPSKAANRLAKPSPDPPSKDAKAVLPTPTAQPPRPSSATTTTTSLWPPHKKGAWAEVTARWLMSLPTNAGKSIKSENVRNILDSNPSYVQLCECLEVLGLQFDRSTLARELLKAVPDGLKPQTVPVVQPQEPGPAVQTNGAMLASLNSQKKDKQRASDGHATLSPTAVRTLEYEAPSSLADVAREVNAMHKPTFQPINTQQGSSRQLQHSPYFAQTLSPINRAGSSSVNFPSASRASSSAASSEVKPIVKVEEPRRPPADKEEAARKRTFGDLVDLTTQGESDDEDPPPKKMMMNPPDTQQANTQQQDPLAYLARNATSFKQFVMPHMNGLGQGVVSMATQQRPYTNGYAQTPTAMQHSILPSQPLQVPLKGKGPTPAQMQQSRMKGKLLVEPIMRDRAARKTTYDPRTIARDVLLATGRHPDMRGLNSHLAVMQKLLGQHGLDSDGGNRSDLATIRWDVIDPEPAKKPTRDDTKMRRGDGQKDSTPVVKPRLQQPSPELLPLKKRGRPRISDALLTNPTLGTAAANASKWNRSSPFTSHPTIPNPTSDMSAAVGYSAFHQVGADGKKKKGRPFGWRKDVHSRAAQGLEPARKAIAAAKVPATPVVPEYQAYECRWQDCKSELHNAEVLKKHMVKVHGRADEPGGLSCRWRGCEDPERRWGELEAWLGHVDAVHLAPIRWRLGDGPREVDPSTFRETSEIPRYLTDSRGRPITPMISPPTPAASIAPAEQLQTDPHHLFRSSDSLNPPAQAAKQHFEVPDRTSKMNARPSTPTKSVFDTELRGLEGEQRLVGPTMGRMGCLFASEARRQGFLDDEDFEDEVEGSEFDVMDEEEN